MARSKPTALEALAKLREQRENLHEREQELRTQASGELGKLLLDCGAEAIEPAKLKQLVRQAMTLGIDNTLKRLSTA